MTHKCDGETLVAGLFLKNKNWTYFGLTVWSVMLVIFVACSSWVLPKYIGTKLLTTCFYGKAFSFEKKQRSLNLISLSHFLYDFYENIS